MKLEEFMKIPLEPGSTVHIMFEEGGSLGTYTQFANEAERKERFSRYLHAPVLSISGGEDKRIDVKIG